MNYVYDLFFINIQLSISFWLISFGSLFWDRMLVFCCCFLSKRTMMRLIASRYHYVKSIHSRCLPHLHFFYMSYVLSFFIFFMCLMCLHFFTCFHFINVKEGRGSRLIFWFFWFFFFLRVGKLLRESLGLMSILCL